MQTINDYCDVAHRDNGIAQLTIRNAGSLNIVNSAVISGVRQGLETLAKDKSIRALILAGSGEKSFIGGADIKEMVTLDQASAETFIKGLRDLCESVRQFPSPVIARLKGWCLGGGLEVAAACDLRIAAQDAKFGMPEVKVGIPSVIHAALLPILTGANIDAATALNWGLVDQLVAETDLDTAIMAVASSIAECGAEAMRSQKALLKQWEELPLSESIDLSVGVFGQAFVTGEPQRHMRAFLDKKK
jgi:enoyl-CoA hydratase/carnithine racemase